MSEDPPEDPRSSAPPVEAVPVPVEPATPPPPSARLHPDHIAAMLRAEELDRKLVRKQRTIAALEDDLAKAARDLEHARREAALVPTPRPVTRVGLLGAGALFGLLVAAAGSMLFAPAMPDEAASRDPNALNVPLHDPSTASRHPSNTGGWRGRVSTSSSATLPPGTPCEVAVVVTPGRDLACRARVDCGGRTLYGPAPAGMFDCRIDGLDAQGRARISGRDDHVTASDGDPAMMLDTAMRSVRVWESSWDREAFDVTITLDAV